MICFLRGSTQRLINTNGKNQAPTASFFVFIFLVVFVRNSACALEYATAGKILGSPLQIGSCTLTTVSTLESFGFEPGTGSWIPGRFVGGRITPQSLVIQNGSQTRVEPLQSPQEESFINVIRQLASISAFVSSQGNEVKWPELIKQVLTLFDIEEMFPQLLFELFVGVWLFIMLVSLILMDRIISGASQIRQRPILSMICGLFFLILGIVSTLLLAHSLFGVFFAPFVVILVFLCILPGATVSAVFLLSLWRIPITPFEKIFFPAISVPLLLGTLFIPQIGWLIFSVITILGIGGFILTGFSSGQLKTQ